MHLNTLSFPCNLGCVAAYFGVLLIILERFELKGWKNDERLNMYVTNNTIPHGKYFVWYLPTPCFCITNPTSQRSKRVRLTAKTGNV